MKYKSVMQRNKKTGVKSLIKIQFPDQIRPKIGSENTKTFVMKFPIAHKTKFILFQFE